MTSRSRVTYGTGLGFANEAWNRPPPGRGPDRCASRSTEDAQVRMIWIGPCGVRISVVVVFGLPLLSSSLVSRSLLLALFPSGGRALPVEAPSACCPAFP